MSDLRYKINPVAGVVIPGAQAIVSAIAGGMIGYTLALVFDWPEPATIGAAISAVTFGATWAAGLAWWRSTIKPEAELPAVNMPAQTVRVELVQNNGNWIDWLQLPLPRELAIAAAVDLIERNYETSNLGGAGRPLSRSEAELLRDWAIKHELGSWRRSTSHTAGWDLSASGRALVRKLAEERQVRPAPARPELSEGWSYVPSLQTRTNTQTILEE